MTPKKRFLKKKLNARQISERDMIQLSAEQRAFISSVPEKGAVMTGNVIDVMTSA